MTRSEKQKAVARAEDAPLSPLCLVDLPHSLLVLVLRWVEALTLPGKLTSKLGDLESDSDAEACAEASRVSWLIATLLGCESLCSALRSAVRDDAVWLGLSRRCHRPLLPSAACETLEATKWMEANDRYTETDSGHASCRESVLVVRCVRAIRAEQREGQMMAPGGGSFWAAVGMALFSRNPISNAQIVLTPKAASALGQMLEGDLLSHMEQAFNLALHRTDTTLLKRTSPHIPEVNKADLDMLAYVISLQPGIRTQHSWSSGPTPFDGRADKAFDTPLLPELCPELEISAQAAMIQRCARRAGIVKYTGAFAEAIWTRLLRRTASVLQRCAVAMATNLPHEEPTGVGSPQQADAGVVPYQPILAPPPRGTRFQANNPFGPVKEDGSSDEDDEGEGEELTETEDEDESWRVQVRACAHHTPRRLRADITRF